ncbi:MAG TPA: NADH-quinone oxidoreductase subunit C [Solirubrobacterales bacterium]|nr:NADH-quinone oxidoreductase subunit C [Solirubrobacterales bacterium]
MPDAPGLELIAQGIEEGRQGTVIETSVEHGRATLVVNPEGLLHALSWLRDQPDQAYRFLSSVHAADYLPATPRFAVHYELLCRERVERINVKALLEDPAAGNGATGAPGSEAEDAPVDAGLPEIDSCVALYPTAEFQEREAYDFFGIVFKGHPDLRRILMPEDYVGWPQRRDYPMGGEPVLFTHNEIEAPRWFE